MCVCWQRLQTVIFDGSTHGEVVDRLVAAVRKPKHLVHGIVVEATDAGAADSRGFCFQIEHLADHAGLPVKALVEPGAAFADPTLELSQHPDRERTVRSDLLSTGHNLSRKAHVTRPEQIELELFGTA